MKTLQDLFSLSILLIMILNTVGLAIGTIEGQTSSDQEESKGRASNKALQQTNSRTGTPGAPSLALGTEASMTDDAADPSKSSRGLGPSLFADPPASWADSAFRYRKNITINPANVPADLTDFPVLIDLYDSDLQQKARADGWDIMFTDVSGTQLAHELELFDRAYNATHAHLVAWVKANLSGSQDTILSMYFGRPLSPNHANSENVWDTKYMGVWHLKESPTGALEEVKDSTANENDGTTASLTSANQVPGKIDGSLVFDDTNARHVNVSHTSSLQLAPSMTVSAWVRTSDTEADIAVIISKWRASGNKNYWLGKLDSTNFAFYVDETQYVTTSLSLINDGAWHYVVGVADAPNNLLRIYVDDTQRNTASYGGSSETGTSNVTIGMSSDVSGQEWDGGIDEVRVSNMTRSANWIATEYSNQNDTNSFYSVATLEDWSGDTDWVLPIMQHRKNITIKASEVSGSGALTDFPILLDLEDSDLHDTAKAQADGDDICFVDTSGTKLDHEIELFNQTGNGTHAHLVAWIRIPSLSGITDTDITMYYGNNGIKSLANPAGVWSADYGAVWHLGEQATDEGSGTTHSDATGHGYDGTQDGNGDAAGIVGNGQEFDGANDVIDVSAGVGFNPSGDVTISGWFKLDSTFSSSSTTSLVILEKFLDAYDYNLHIGLTGTDYEATGPPDVPDGSLLLKLENANDYYRWSLRTSWAAGTWHHFMILLDASQLSNTQIFINGSDNTGGSYAPLTSGNLGYSSGWGIGGDQSDKVPLDQGWFEGVLDEIRVATALRSADWIATEFANQNDSASFFSVSPEEKYADWWVDGSFTRRKEIIIDKDQVGLASESRILRPNGAGYRTALSRYGASTNWQAVDEASSDGDTSYVYRGADTWDYDSYTAEDVGSMAGTTINSVTIKFNGKRSGTGTTYGRTVLRTYSQNYWGNSYTLGYSYAVFSQEYSTNPNTGSAWTWSEINNMQIGVALRRNTGYETPTARATQVWAEINYSMTVPLTDFPVLIDITSTDFKSGRIQPDGDDLLFTDVNQTKLAHEVQHFSQTSLQGHLIAWVRVPTLSKSEDTILSMYYGNDELISQENGRAVWDSNYVGVWHLDETSGGTSAIQDATGYGNAGTDTGSPTFGQSGQIGNATRFDGTNDAIQIADDTSLHIANQITVEAWINPDTIDWMSIVSKMNGQTEDLYLTVDNNGNLFLGLAPVQVEWTTAISISAGLWQHVVFTYDGQFINAFKDGIVGDSQSASGTLALSSNTNPLYLGWNTAWTNEYWDGFLDEIRISNVARSSDWIATEFQNQNDSASFYSVGTESFFDSNHPIVTDFGITDGGDGSPTFWAEVIDGASTVSMVNVTIDGTESAMSLNATGYWTYTTTDVTFGSLISYHIANASDTYGNYMGSPTFSRSYTFTLDTVAPTLVNWDFDPTLGQYGAFKANVSDWGVIHTVIVNVTEMAGSPQNTMWAVMQNTASGYINDTLDLEMGILKYEFILNDTAANSWRSSEFQDYIANHVPIASNLRFSRDPAQDLLPVWSNCTLYLDYDFYDRDGHSESTATEIRWYRNNGGGWALVPEYNDTKQIPASELIRDHEWNATVRPNDGQAYGALNYTLSTVTIKNTPPKITSVEISPDTGSIFYNTSDLVASNTTTDTDGALDLPLTFFIKWYNNATGVFLEQGGLADKAVIEAGNTTKNQAWYCNVTAWDGYNYSNWLISTAIVIANSHPTLTNIAFNDTTPTTVEFIKATYTFSDADNDGEVQVWIRWLEGGAYNDSLTGQLILTPADTSPGEYYQYNITVNDGTDNSTWYISTVLVITGGTFVNTPPEAQSVSLTPTTPNTTVVLVVSYTFYDFDGHQELARNITWYVGGAYDNTFDNWTQIPSSYTTKGQQWYFNISVYDGLDWSDTVKSPVRDIQNSAAIISEVVISPDSGSAFYNTSMLLISNSTTDADGDPLTFYVTWYNNATGSFELLPGLSNKTIIEAANTTKNQAWYCNVTAWDGAINSTFFISSTIVILNSRPIAENLRITVDPKTGDNLVADWDFYDADNDPQSTNWVIIWYNNTVEQFHLEDKKTVESGNTTKGEVWYYTLQVYDGQDYSVQVYSLIPAVIILNTIPEATTYTLTAAPTTTDDLTISWTYDDVDGDTETNNWIISWYLHNGIDWELQSAWNNKKTVPSSATNKNEWWNCTFRVHDGGAYSDSYSLTTWVINTAPTISEAIISPDSGSVFYNTSMLLLSNTTIDVDADSLTFYITWYNNATGSFEVQTHLYNKTIIEAANTTKNQAWYCNVTAWDGTANSTFFISSTIFIENSPPIASGLKLTADPTTIDNLIANWTYYDADGDLQSTNWKIRWYNNTLYVEGLDDAKTIEAGNTTKLELWYYTLEVYDGQDYSQLYTFVPFVRIRNSAPTASYYTISSNPTTEDNLVASWGYDDADGEIPLAIIRWYWDNGTDWELISAWNDQAVVFWTATTKGETWRYTLQLYDQNDYSIEYISANATIQNSLTVISQAWIIESSINESYADINLVVSWNSADADGDDEEAVRIFWYRNNTHIDTYDNFTSIPSTDLLKGYSWYCEIAIYDGEEWSLIATSQEITIINKAPEISNYQFIVSDETRRGSFFVEDEDLRISYEFLDVDNDSNFSIIYWYVDGEYQPTYDNWTVIPASNTQPGQIWFFRILPFDGTDYGNPVIAPINMTIESRPRIEDYGIIPRTDYDGHYDFWILANDPRNEITDVRLEFSTTAIPLITNFNGTHYVSYDYESLLEYLNSNVSVTISVATLVASSNDILRATLNFNLTVEDNAPPRVSYATYYWDDDENPTNITFAAIIEEDGSGIAQVLIYYRFQSSAEVPTNTTTTEGGIHLYSLAQNDINWSNAAMTFNETHWVVTVPFKPKTSVNIYYKIWVMDNDGNVNDPDAKNDPERTGLPFTLKEGGGVDPEFFQQILMIVAIAFLAVIAFSAVAIKKWRTTELVGLDKERVIQNMAAIRDAEVENAIPLHSLGVIVSFFDQRHGPLPIIIIPEILRDNFEKLVELSDHSFSVCQFLDTFDEETFATFDFVLGRGIRVNSISFAFALDRPSARGGAENITVNVLIQPDVFPLVNQFVDHFVQKIHEIHVTMDKEPSKREKILANVKELRKQISYIVLSYEQLYGTTELIEE